MLPGLEFFLDLEREVWEALRAGDPVADARLLAADFLGVYATGFANRAQHAALLERGSVVADYAISDARLLRLTDDLALLCYRADYRPCAHGKAGATQTMFVSSIWQQRGDAWRNVFSQDTHQRGGTDG